MMIPHWELSVLCRSVAHLNLSAASTHVGLSQPQLSRIVAKLEAELGITLLDRTAKRHSTWTPEAHKLAEIYGRAARGLEAEVESLGTLARPTRLAVGCLEGLIEHAARVCHGVLTHEKLKTIELDVHDIDTLETLFLNGSLDAIYTSRELGRRKPKYARVIAAQTLEPTGRDESIAVRSQYEQRSLPTRDKSKHEAVIVSNSLAARRHWIEQYGGRGIVPSKPKKRDPRNSREVPVYLFGSDRLRPEIWRQLERLSAKT